MSNIKTTITEVLAVSGLAASRSEARRMIAQNEVIVEGFQVVDPLHPISITSTLEIKVGKWKVKNVVVSDYLKVKALEETPELDFDPEGNPEGDPGVKVDVIRRKRT